MGFFTAEEKTGSRLSRVCGCGQCKLYKGCRSPKMEVTGKGRREILVVAEAPGKNEDQRGTQLVGDAGQVLRECMDDCGVDLDRDCWKTNAVRCRPPDNRKPTDREIESCRPDIFRIVRECRPRVILLLGGAAVKSVVGRYWPDVGGIGRWAGLWIPRPDLEAWLCCTWHPSYLLHEAKNKPLKLLFRRHVAEAVQSKERPSVPTDWKSRVRRYYEADVAAAAIQSLAETGRPLAFDYETDRLKPDHPDARIICCSVSDGEVSAAYPWTGEAVEATRDVLWSKNVPKIGWNMKFEERWTRRVLGKGVRNWMWDGMQGAHVLDNRPRFTSLKFQSFVRLGVEPYNEAVEGMFKAKSGNDRSKIGRVPLEDLLLYNGLDSLFTAVIGLEQMDEMGI